ncbi:unnamed protein product [Meloidogyne enterolobii]|uniref:Uncharacterized protein n=1 Tax=Meloidogyne enterolobii TaxID=390850 RepID=A0ACB0YLY0_MELEN
MRDVKQPVSSTNLVVYRICRVGFGIICSPAILAVVIRHHLAKNDKLEMANNLYVDNLLLECETLEEADAKCTEAKEIFARAKMNLREFISHSPQVMNSVASDDRLKVEQYAKVLGMKWQLESDGIHFEFPGLKGNVPSRRSILSVLASVYDPMGLVSPCLLPAKCLFQDSWNNAKDWDDVLPVSIATKWKAILTDWDQKSIDVPRKIIVETGARLELHTFVDASNLSFAAAVYLKSHIDEKSMTSLIFSKNRLKPLKGGKTLTIPRMELLAILIGVRAMEFAKNELKREIAGFHLWSDSQIALSWINTTETQPIFVERRLGEIRRHEHVLFHYVRTDQNPADIATRGMSPIVLRDTNLWWEGPEWLKRSSNKWPAEKEFHVNKREIQEIDLQEQKEEETRVYLIWNLEAFNTSNCVCDAFY